MNVKPALIGIVNITPDSFSDGGSYPTIEHALTHIEELIVDGAAVIDIGAESTRPGAIAQSSQQEWDRLKDFLPRAVALCHERKVAVSIDTYHPQTAASALAQGVDWINDVTGFADAAMMEVVKSSDCRLVMMHSLSVPADPQQVLPDNSPASMQVREWAIAQIARIEKYGIERTRIILDPGVGFGKSALQSLELLMNTKRLMDLGCALLIGHSRKSFLKLFTQAPVAQRDELTLAFSALLAGQGVDYLRVHNVKAHRDLWNQL